MKYMLLAYSPENAWTREEWLACTAASGKICDELRAQGCFIAATPLQPVATAASIRVRGGETLVTAGPFAETVEQLGGFFLIDVPSLDEAIAVAARLPSAAKGTIEIRPVQALAGVPEPRFAAPPPPDTARYLLLCYDDDAAWTRAGPAALGAAQAEAAAHTQDLARRGQYVAAAPLHPVTTATSVRLRHGKRLVTDGPFAETTECLGGYYVVDVRDLNDAIAIAAKHPGARISTVEVRRLVDLTALPAG
jgi:hypothetical protein